MLGFPCSAGVPIATNCPGGIDGYRTRPEFPSRIGHEIKMPCCPWRHEVSKQDTFPLSVEASTKFPSGPTASEEGSPASGDSKRILAARLVAGMRDGGKGAQTGQHHHYGPQTCFATIHFKIKRSI